MREQIDMPQHHYGRHSTFHQIDIHASTDEVWQAIMAFQDWPSWNPLYLEADGSFEKGSTVRFTVSIPGLSPQKGEATVITFEPGTSVEYQLRSMGGLSRATRFIEVIPGENGHCTLVNGERMGGLLAPILSKLLGEKIRQGLQGMNEALKSRLENRQ